MHLLKAVFSPGRVCSIPCYYQFDSQMAALIDTLGHLHLASCEGVRECVCALMKHLEERYVITQG